MYLKVSVPRPKLGPSLGRGRRDQHSQNSWEMKSSDEATGDKATGGEVPGNEVRGNGATGAVGGFL